MEGVAEDDARRQVDQDQRVRTQIGEGAGLRFRRQQHLDVDIADTRGEPFASRTGVPARPSPRQSAGARDTPP